MLKRLFSTLSVACIGLLAFSISVLSATINVPADQPTIQAGVDAAANGDLVLVAPGTYTGTGNINVNFNGKAITVKSYDGPQSTIIDCGAPGNRAFVFDHEESATSILDGFTIRNGDVRHRYEGGLPDKLGGGIKIKASPTIQECVFENCRAENGGGLSAALSGISPVIEQCSFFYDSASSYNGGAIYYGNGSSIAISDCSFGNNRAVGSGGAIFIGGQNSTVGYCDFYSNNCADNGGAIYAGAAISISNCTFAKNKAMFGSALLVATGVATEFMRNIAAFNEGNTGAVRVNTGGSIIFGCNDFWNNTTGHITGTYDSTDVDPNTIFQDPLFCSLQNDIYSISAFSPCDEDDSPCGQLIGRLDNMCGIGVVGDGSLYSKWKSIFNPFGLPASSLEKLTYDGGAQGREADIHVNDSSLYSGGNDNHENVASLKSELVNNFPNPFNPTTTISMRLPVASDWTIRIYNNLGQKLDEFNGHNGAGIVSIAWDGSKHASGVYFYRFQAGDLVEAKKMVLLK